MLFSSLTFLFMFLPLVLILYYVIKNRKYRNLILLIFSLIFYAWGEPIYVFLMLFIILGVYVFGLLIDNYKKKRTLLIFSIIYVLIFLLFFKYGNFLINNINSFLNTKISNIKLSLPIGISFFSFQAISYLIDVYRKKVKVQKNILNLALYISLFPQLIAGPIVRYDTIEDELNNRKENVNDFINGLKRFIIGLSKKILIANQMALITDTIFNNMSNVGTSIAWIGALAYTFQIYFDFSGYSDMAIGLGEMFGFHFLENFNYPYISKSVTEFWRRWHISLSSWFKDYVYIPLGGNRVKKYRHIFNIMIVWLLTGLWHGANWNFIIWGLYYGIILLIDKYVLNKMKLNKYIKWLCTFIIIIIGWIIFRIENMNNLIIYISKLFNFSSSNYYGLFFENSSIFYAMLYFIPAIIFSFPLYKLIKERYDNKMWFNILLNIVLICLFLGCITFLMGSSYNPFIYFRF